MPGQLFEREVVLMGGAHRADFIVHSGEDRKRYFFVQLNHHFNRRFMRQTCDWLIARQGSGMIAGTFLKIPEQHRRRIRFISCQVNQPERFAEWDYVAQQQFATLFPFHESAFPKLNPYHHSLEWCNQFWNQLQTNPFIGVLAIKMILLFPVKSLWIRGFDFFREPNGTIRKKLSCHVIGRQIEWLRELYNSDMRITVDDDLLAVLKLTGQINRGNIKPYNVNEEPGV